MSTRQDIQDAVETAELQEIKTPDLIENGATSEQIKDAARRDLAYLATDYTEEGVTIKEDIQQQLEAALGDFSTFKESNPGMAQEVMEALTVVKSWHLLRENVLEPNGVGQSIEEAVRPPERYLDMAQHIGRNIEHGEWSNYDDLRSYLEIDQDIPDVPVDEQAQADPKQLDELNEQFDRSEPPEVDSEDVGSSEHGGVMRSLVQAPRAVPILGSITTSIAGTLLSTEPSHAAGEEVQQQLNEEAQNEMDEAIQGHADSEAADFYDQLGREIGVMMDDGQVVDYAEQHPDFTQQEIARYVAENNIGPGVLLQDFASIDEADFRDAQDLKQEIRQLHEADNGVEYFDDFVDELDNHFVFDGTAFEAQDPIPDNAVPVDVTEASPEQINDVISDLDQVDSDEVHVQAAQTAGIEVQAIFVETADSDDDAESVSDEAETANETVDRSEQAETDSTEAQTHEAEFLQQLEQATDGDLVDATIVEADGEYDSLKQAVRDGAIDIGDAQRTLDKLTLGDNGVPDTIGMDDVAIETVESGTFAVYTR